MTWIRACALGATAALALGAPLAVSGCDNEAGASVEAVKIGGQPFTLELALEDTTRFKGLSGRTHIEDDGGLIFVFPANQVRVQAFVMRDCPIPIDIMYLDGSGSVLAMHAMTPEPPRGPDEGHPDEPPGSANMKYNRRLKPYSSRFPSQIVIELKGGTLERLKVKEGDKVEFTDLGALKKRAR